MYQRSDLAFGGGAAVLSGRPGRPVEGPLDGGFATREFGCRETRIDWRDRFAHLDFAPDLGARLGSRDWWRGFATLTGLLAAAWALTPGFAPLATAPAMLDADHWQEARALGLAPLALGADTGRRMAPSDTVRPLTDIPERPSIDLVATLGAGDGFARVLTRTGVGESEARRIADIVAGAASLDAIKPGTRMDVTLGRRSDRTVARPLDFLAFRAALDLRLELTRVGGALTLKRVPIAVDRTPLRIKGRRGDSLVTSARAAGMPARTIEAFLKVLGAKSLVGDLQPDDRFDVIVGYARAETGEVEVGDLLYAGLDQGRKNHRLMPWTVDGRTDWFDADGVGRKRGGMAAPVRGRLTSGFGMRRHPLLGYSRFHRGQDFGAPHGSPIQAVTDGLVAFAGRNGGYGNSVRLSHSGGLGTSYSHMSRIAVSPGSRVRQGQVIGYVGSTGLSTGPHLHFEVYRNGGAVNPRSVNFASTSLLTGAELANFRAKLNALLAIKPGAR